MLMPIQSISPELNKSERGILQKEVPAEEVSSHSQPNSAREILAWHHGQIDWEAITPDGWYSRFGRRAFELGLILAISPVVIPLVGLVALLNAVSSGSLRDVFFFQDRIGRFGKPFRIVKFRTMKPVSCQMSSWSSGDEQMRVTRLGRLLRNSHLDELPQLWNVLRGDMHLIGPRPEMVEIEAWACEEVEGFSERLALRPGITGYAQIRQGYTGRDVDAYRRKLELCREYKQRLSLRTDLGIIAATLLWMARGKGWKWSRSAPRDASDLKRAA